MATNSNIIEIIIRAQDQASQAAKNVQKNISNIGKTSSSVQNIATNAFQKIQNSMQKINTTTHTVTQALTRGFTQFKTTATTAFTNVTQNIQNTITQSKFYQTHLQQYSPIFQQIQNTASNAFGAVASKISTIQQTTSSTFQQVRSSIENTATDIKTKMMTAVDSMKEKFTEMKPKITEVSTMLKNTMSSATDAVKSKIHSLSEAFSGVAGQMAGMLGMFGVGSFTQMTVGLSMAREQMTALMTATLGSRQEAEKYVEELRELTSKSLVRLGDIGTAMSKIKMTTGMTNDQLKKIAPTVNDIGQRAILMGKSNEEAAELMVAAYRGLNGDLHMLRNNFGITRDLLLDMGWSGAASDVEGYTDALQKALDRGGDVSGMMDTTTGKVNQIKSAFSTAGLKIGKAIQPVIDKILDFLVSVRENCPQAFEAILLLFGAISGLVAIAPTLAPLLMVFTSLKSAITGAHLATKLFNVTAGILDFVTTMTTKSMTLNTLAVQAGIISAEEGAVANMGLGTSLKFAARSALALTKALLLNPYTWIAIAVIALVAVMWHLYNTNEEVRNTFNAIADYIKGSLINAWNTLVYVLQRVWEMLVEVGTYLFNKFTQAWEKIRTMLEPLLPVFGRLKDAFVKLIQAFSGGGDAAGDAGDTFDTLGAILGAVEWYLKNTIDSFVFMVEILSAVLIPVIGFVVDYFSAFITAIAGVVEAVEQLANGEIGLAEFFEQIGAVLATFYDSVYTAMITFFTTLLQNIDLALDNILTDVWNWAVSMVNGFITAAQQSVNGFITWLASLPGLAWLWLVNTLNKAYDFGVSVKNTLANAANQAVSEFIKWISQLPGRAWTWLVNTVNKAKTFAGQLLTALRNAASSAVSGFANKVAELPQKMWDELCHVRDRINQGVGMVVSAIQNLAYSIIDGFKAAMHISSPGLIHDLMEGEILYVKDAIINGAQTVGSAAGILAEGIINGFGQPLGEEILLPTVNANISMTTQSLDIDAKTSQFDYLVNTTTDVVDRMVEAWEYMKDEILASAQEISEFPTHNESGTNGINTTHTSSTIMGTSPNANKTTYDGEVTVHVIHDFTNIPSSLTAQQVQTIMTETSKDKDWIHQLVQNTEFQKQDVKMKVRNTNRRIRNGGYTSG